MRSKVGFNIKYGKMSGGSERVVRQSVMICNYYDKQFDPIIMKTDKSLFRFFGNNSDDGFSYSGGEVKRKFLQYMGIKV